MNLAPIAAELQQLYRIDPMPPLAECLISTERFQDYCRTHPTVDATTRETLIIEQHATHVDVGLYIAPEILERVRRNPPWHNLHADNVDATCVAIEGVSHLVCLWWKQHRELPCSLLELELQAEIDKYLLCSRWLAQQGRPRTQLLTRLFHHYALGGGMTGEAAQRYHRASRLAWQFCRRDQDRLSTLVTDARDFYRLTHWQKLRALPLEPKGHVR